MALREQVIRDAVMPVTKGSAAMVVEGISHDYPSRGKAPVRRALDNLSLSVLEGEIFGLLGPNGSGKTTLFRILTGLLSPSNGKAKIFDADCRDAAGIRPLIGVTFQHPSLDRRLTVRENLQHQGHLYGLRGSALGDRIQEILPLLGISDRVDDFVGNLSGGLQRRVELAKGLLHRPRFVLLDEPSTGLDPGARREFGDYLKRLRDQFGLTAVLTTHILDEADECDRIAILDEGRLVACGSPVDLKQEIGGDVVSVISREPAQLQALIGQRFQTQALLFDGVIRIEQAKGHEFIPQLVEAFPGRIDSVTLSRPTIEDVFIHKTGHRFRDRMR